MKQHPPERKPGYAATVGQAQPATTPMPNTYYGLLGAVNQMSAAISTAKGLGIDVGDSEAVLASLVARLAQTPVPANPFNG